MARPPINWKKKHEAAMELINHTQDILTQTQKTIEELESKYKNLSKEFSKAVEVNKEFQNTIVEQRGIIHYLESQVSKMDVKITELENK